MVMDTNPKKYILAVWHGFFSINVWNRGRVIFSPFRSKQENVWNLQSEIPVNGDFLVLKLVVSTGLEWKDFVILKHQEVSDSPTVCLQFHGRFWIHRHFRLNGTTVQANGKKVEDEWCMLIHPSCKLNLWSFCWRIFFAAIPFSGNQLESVTWEESPINTFKNFRHFVGSFFSNPIFPWKIMVVHDHPLRRPYGSWPLSPKPTLGWGKRRRHRYRRFWDLARLEGWKVADLVAFGGKENMAGLEKIMVKPK